MIDGEDQRVSLLMGGERPWWDVWERKLIKAVTLYMPFGCPDWGETKGKRNGLCTFCMLPNAVIAYRDAFYGGTPVPDRDLIELFRASLYSLKGRDFHTLMIFNAGSFTAMPQGVQEEIFDEIARRGGIRRVVIESRAALLHKDIGFLERLRDILELRNIKLTIRIGIETQYDHLRLKVLKKGHGRRELDLAMKVLKDLGINSGGYALLNPSPGLDADWAMGETEATLDWILGRNPGQLGMDEAYFCSTNVGPGTPLEQAWRRGLFRPASLWMVLKVLLAVAVYGGRVHLLPFRDEPELLAVPSNHIPGGIPQDLTGAEGCDLEFHSMLDKYRKTMDPGVLYIPACRCKPSWF